MLVLVAELLLAVSVAAAPAPVAVLPSVGTASEGVRRDVDSALRGALLDIESIDLLSPVETRRHLVSLAEMGLVCLPDDVTCLVKLGLAANVSFVLVPEATPADDDMVDVEIGVIDVSEAQRARTVTAHLSTGDAAAAVSLVHRALGLDAPAPADPAKDPPDRVVPDDTVDHKTPPVDDDGRAHPTLDDTDDGAGAAPAEGKPLAPAAVVTGVAAAVGVIALGGAVTCDLLYSDTLPLADAKTRKDIIQPVGAGLWVTTAFALAGVGAGAYLLITTPDDTP